MATPDLLKWRAATAETAFENQEVTDQEISEQEYFDHGILMVAFVRAGVELAYETMVEAGIIEESAYYESLHETPLIANLIARKKLYEMNVVISDTAEYGCYLFDHSARPFLEKEFMPEHQVRRHRQGPRSHGQWRRQQDPGGRQRGPAQPLGGSRRCQAAWLHDRYEGHHLGSNLPAATGSGHTHPSKPTGGGNTHCTAAPPGLVGSVCQWMTRQATRRRTSTIRYCPDAEREPRCRSAVSLRAYPAGSKGRSPACPLPRYRPGRIRPRRPVSPQVPH